ncbi:MAG: hypothetical protein RIQ81_152 [Pseudomonadota bacterium]
MSGVKLESLHGRIRRSYEESLRNVGNHAECIQRLRAELDAFPALLHQASAVNEFLDLDLAKSVHRTCLKLMAFCETSTNSQHVTFVLAAIHYFVNRLDGSPDFFGLDGFEDDAVVVNTVITDLAINLPTIQFSGSKESA